MAETEYAWEKDKTIIEKTTFEKLRQKDIVALLYPYHTFDSGIAGGGTSLVIQSEQLLRLEASTDYKINVTVKGDDSEGCAVITKKDKTIKPIA